MTKYRYTYRWGYNEKIELNGYKYPSYPPDADLNAVRNFSNPDRHQPDNPTEQGC